MLGLQTVILKNRETPSMSILDRSAMNQSFDHLKSFQDENNNQIVNTSLYHDRNDRYKKNLEIKSPFRNQDTSHRVSRSLTKNSTSDNKSALTNNEEYYCKQLEKLQLKLSEFMHQKSQTEQEKSNLEKKVESMESLVRRNQSFLKLMKQEMDLVHSQNRILVKEREQLGLSQ